MRVTAAFCCAAILTISCEADRARAPQPLSEPAIAAEVAEESEPERDAGGAIELEDAGVAEIADAGSDAGADEQAAERAVLQPHRPYERAIYRRRCRAVRWQRGEAALTMDLKSDARERARALARAGELDEILLFARILHGETGTPRRANDDPSTPLWEEAQAILMVLDGRRGAMSRAEMFAAYSPRRLFPHPEDQRQLWVAELALDGAMPPHWPRHIAHPRWTSWGCPRWLATLDAAKRVLESAPGRLTEGGPCEEVPDHWGGEVGIDDREHLGWRQIDCGSHVRNRYWSVPPS